MRQENKCFFSISLENGIVITGENPEQVREFLEHMWNGLISELNDPDEEKAIFPKWYAEQEDLAKRINDAILTIVHNTRAKGGKK